MLSFFKRSKPRNNDKHTAKHQKPHLAATTAISEHNHRQQQPPAVAQCNLNEISVDASSTNTISSPTVVAVAAAARHVDTDVRVERRDVDFVRETEPEPHQPVETVACERRDANYSSTKEHGVVDGAPNTAASAQHDVASSENDEKRASKSSKTPFISSTLFGGFLGEIMAKGRNRRHNHNHNNNSGPKNKHQQHQQAQQPTPFSHKSTDDDIDPTTSSTSNDTYEKFRSTGRQHIAEPTPVPTAADHLHLSAILGARSGHATSDDPPSDTSQSQTECADSLDFDSTSKNSASVEFIDDERAPNDADREPTPCWSPATESTTDRGTISCSPPSTVVAVKQLDRLIENRSGADHSINDPADRASNNNNHQHNNGHSTDSRATITTTTTATGGGDLRHCDDIRHNATNTRGGKNSPTPHDPRRTAITFNAVAENTTGAVSSEREIPSNTVDNLRSNCPPERFSSAVTASANNPINRPTATIADRAPLADDEFDDDDDLNDPNEDTSNHNTELEPNPIRADSHSAHVITSPQMGQQQSTKSAPHPGQPAANHPHPVSKSQSIPVSASADPINYPPPTPDDKEIFYEAAADASELPQSAPLDIRPPPVAATPNEFGPSSASSDRSVYSEPNATTTPSDSTAVALSDDESEQQCGTTVNSADATESRAANINNGGDRSVPANAAPSTSSDTNYSRQQPHEEEHRSEQQQHQSDEDQDGDDNDDADDGDDDDDEDTSSVGVENGTTTTVRNDNEPKQTVISSHHHPDHNKNPHASVSNKNNNSNDIVDTDDEYDCCEDDDDDDEEEEEEEMDAGGLANDAKTKDSAASSTASDDDPENDSPDSGIDVVADIADISRILTQLERGDNATTAPQSASAAVAPTSQSTSASHSLGLSAAHIGEHSARSTSSGLESDLSDDQCSAELNPKLGGGRRGPSTTTSAFTSKDNATGPDASGGGQVPRKCNEPASRKSTTVVRATNGGVGADETVSISLPDIVESIGSNTSPGGGGTVGGGTVGGSNVVNMVASGVQHVGTSADTSCSSESESSDCGGGDEPTQQELIEEKMRDLVDQEARFSVQLEEAEKQAFDSRAKADDLSYQISELERNLTVKIWNVERLQAELQAAFQEGECVKRKVKLQETEIETQRKKFASREEELEVQFSDLENQHKDLKAKLEGLEQLTTSLQTQLDSAQCEAATIRLEKESCQQEHAAECLKLQSAIDAAVAEKAELEVKWQKEFEQLRTHHSDREEHLLQDCEWKLRTTEQSCKAKTTAAESARAEAVARAQQIETDAQLQMDEVKHLRSYEAEVCQLRGLTSVQSETIATMTQQLKELKDELEEANEAVAASIETVRKIKFQCEQEISDKHRQMVNKIEEARGDVAVMWEDRLMEEMSRLKMELESCYAEDRADALRVANTESLAEIAKLTESFSAKEKELCQEIDEFKKIVAQKHSQLEEANDRSDKQVMQIRMILDRAEREHEREMSAEIAKRDELAESMRSENESERQRMEEIFRERLLQVSQEFATELTNNNDELEARHKKKSEQQYEKLMAEKEETIQNLERAHKRKTTDWETKFRDMEISHQRDLKDTKSQLSLERSSFEQRDHQSAQEIDQLHKKCKCLTKLFEEMRMRYERRDPRPEDLRDIEEMRTRLETQDREMSQMTEQLRKYQLNSRQNNNQNQQNNNNSSNGQQPQQQQQQQQQRKQKGKNNNKAKVNCNVIYEENEDREASPNGFFAKTVEL